MAMQVTITNGTYRGNPVSGTFELIRPYNGTCLTVKPHDDWVWPHGSVSRINCGPNDFKVIGENGAEVTGALAIVDGGKIVEPIVNYEQQFMQLETEDEAMERIADTFLMLDKITDACARNVVRGLVVSGPPGVGKSFGVEKQLEAANIFRKMAGKDPKYEVVSGGVSSIGLYQKLYYNRGADQVLVFDDCDGVLFEEECLNLLKAALNSGDKRRICWNKESRVLATDDIPEHFDFEGSIIFLSNIDFERTIAKGSRIAKHLEAIMSRCHYLDLEIGTLRDKLLRIKQIVRDGMLTQYNFSSAEETKILEFVFDNAEYLREVSLRMVKKIADFVKTDPKSWEEMAEATCLQREAKFKRLLNKKKAEAEKRGLALAGTQ